MLDFNINFQFPSVKKNRTCDFDKKEYDDFIIFMKKVESDLNECLCLFLESKGTSYSELIEEDNNIKNVIPNKTDYEEFIHIFNNAKYSIDKILYREEYNSIAKREITENIFTVKDFIYKNYNSKENTENKIENSGKKSYLSLFITIFLLYLILTLLKN